MILECTHLIVQFCKCKVSFVFFFIIKLRILIATQSQCDGSLALVYEFWILFSFQIVLTLNNVVEELGLAYAP